MMGGLEGGLRGRILALAFALALLAPLAPAQDPGAREYGGKANFCHLLVTLSSDPGPPCPRVRQSGTLTPGACAEDACALSADVSAQGEGVRSLRKTLAVDAALDGAEAGETLCFADTAEASLSCERAGASFTVPLLDGQCRALRLRATLVEAADVERGLPVRAQTEWQVCRSGAATLLF